AAFPAIWVCSVLATPKTPPPFTIPPSPPWPRHSFAALPAFALPWPFPLPFVFLVSITVSSNPDRKSFAGCYRLRSLGQPQAHDFEPRPRRTLRRTRHRLSHDHEPSPPAHQQIPLRIVNLADAKPVAPLLPLLPAAHHDFGIGRHRLSVLDIQFRGHCPFLRQLRDLAHHFVQQDGYPSSVDESRASAVARAENEPTSRAC